MSVEVWKMIFDWGTVILLFLTFAFGAGALITGNVIGKRQEARLRQFDANLTAAKTELGRQQERAANADARVAGLEKDASDAKREMADQQERAATAEHSLLELKERIKPRRLDDEQCAEFIAILKTFPNVSLRLSYTQAAGDEGLNFLKQIMPLFTEANWKTPKDLTDVADHLDIQVIGIALLIPGPEGSDPRKPQPDIVVRLTSQEVTLQRAFQKIGMELQFQRWYPDPNQVPELVIGSKPDPYK